MRYSMGIAVLGLVVLAGCATPPSTKAPAAAVNADAGQQTATAAVKKPKNCIVGTRLCTHEQEADPSVQGMSNEGLADSQRGHASGWTGPK